MSQTAAQLAEIEIVTITPDGGMAYNLQWTVVASAAGAGPFNFTVLRSGSPTGSFETVASSLGDVYTYRDTTPLLVGNDKVVYYQIVSGAFSSRVVSSMMALPRQKFLIWRKIINDEKVMLSKGNGIPVAIFKRKHWGPRCTTCIDPKTLRILVKNCLSCFGTTFEGGYFSPVPTLAKIAPSAPGTDFTTDTSVPEVEAANMFLHPFPLVRRGDIVVEPATNIRWEIVSEQPTEILRNPVHQDINISRLPPADLIYHLALS
jgi:hypothetical protein